MKTSSAPARLLTTKELADYLGKKPGWLHTRAADLGLPSIRVGNHLRWDLDAVLDHLRKTS